MTVKMLISVFLSFVVFTCFRVGGQNVLTRILPSDELILNSPPLPAEQGQGQTQGSRSHGRAIVWCLVQDLDPDSDKVKSIELFFKSAPQVRSSLTENGEVFEGSFSQFGFPTARDAEQKDTRRGGKEGGPSGPSQDVGSRENPVERPEGFPDAQFTGLSRNQTDAREPDLRDLTNRDSRLDKRGLLLGSVPVAKVSASVSAQLGVRHVQRSGVSVRGVISTSNPNLSSLQVSMQQARCTDCGTYMCVLRYQDRQGDITETRGSNDLIVAQSVTHRLNLRLMASRPPAIRTPTARNNDSIATEEENHARVVPPNTELFCFGTISNPSMSLRWRRQGLSNTRNVSRADPVDTPKLIRQGEPRLGPYCQHWRASLLSQVWEDSEDLWVVHCFLSHDEGVSASALLDKEGSIVTAVCGDPKSTLMTKEGDDVSVICDVNPLTDVTSMTWQRKGADVGRCEKTAGATSWNCNSSESRYSVGKDNTRFVLNITGFHVTEDRGKWACLLLPLAPEMAASCMLG